MAPGWGGALGRGCWPSEEDGDNESRHLGGVSDQRPGPGWGLSVPALRPPSHVQTEAASHLVLGRRFGLQACGSLSLRTVLLPLLHGTAFHSGRADAMPRDAWKQQGPRCGSLQ